MISFRRATPFAALSSCVAALLTLLVGMPRAAAAPQPEPNRGSPPEAPSAPSDQAPDSAAGVRVQPMHAAAGMVLVRLSAGDHPFSVFFGRAARPIAACASACAFWAWPGEYRVQVTDGEAPHIDATVPLRVQRSASYAFVPANGKSQNAGLILGVSGPVLGVVGLVLTGVGLFKTCHESVPGEGCERPSSLYLGLGAVALGAAMTTSGWLVYAYNRAQFRASGANPARTQASLTFRPMQDATLGLRAVLTF